MHAMPPKRKLKVKSGCRTCKIRKVKCDEGKPACNKCMSTGRVCGGYGIWGGGGNTYGRLTVGPRDGYLTHVSCAPTMAATADERRNFNWFACRTAPKLMGAFTSEFWQTLVCKPTTCMPPENIPFFLSLQNNDLTLYGALMTAWTKPMLTPSIAVQAGSQEPAVLHSSVALSSVHRVQRRNSDSAHKITKQDIFVMQQYSKAIALLQPHFKRSDRAAVRVALITCIVFICIDYLRGHFRTGYAHLQNGLKLLGNTYTKHQTRDSIDEWLIDTFVRLHLQAYFFGCESEHSAFLLRVFDPKSLSLMFETTQQARQRLDRLFMEIAHLTNQISQRNGTCSPELRYSQQRIQQSLSEWLRTYRSSRLSLEAKMTTIDMFGYQLLYIYHVMACIMIDTCVDPTCQSSYDVHTASFASMLSASVTLLKTATSQPMVDSLPETGADMSRSIADTGGIAPLYFTATRCRDHRIRHEALGVMENRAPRRETVNEGIWDSDVSALVAEEVVRLEEGDFYKDVNLAEELPDDRVPEDCEKLELLVLPESYRMTRVQVVLPNEPEENVVLVCRRRNRDGIEEVLTREYDHSKECWVNRPIAGDLQYSEL